MRRFDRKAVFNIFFKLVLFLAAFGCFFCIFSLLLGIKVVFAIVGSAFLAMSIVFLFSYLLRYTKFYYRYYSFLSEILFSKKEGAVYCPCCGKSFDSFKDERYYADTEHFNPLMFVKSRQDVICDCCRSAPRHRIIAMWSEENLKLIKNSKILFFAPELSMMLWFKRHGVDVTTADLYEKRADLKLDITNLNLPDESQDIIFCNHVIEHVSDYKGAFSELRRVLKKSGRLIISFPIDFSLESVYEAKTTSADERIKLFGQSDHLRIFGKDSKKVLEDFGFIVDTIDVSKMPDNIVPVTGPADYDTNIIFCCTKK